MLCQQCLKREAQFHSYRIINNELLSVHLCARCVENRKEREDHNSIDDKLHSILDVLLKKNVHDGNSSETRRCESCGTTLDEYEKSGLVGCPRCYELFADTIFGGRVKRHVSDPDRDRSGAGTEFLKRLEVRLKKAVESEDFEEAAHIRDRINNLEKEGFFGDS
ncbi:MAG: UvrB/UvrC motif-containing protein [Spirochaetes bacterium]|nr:UvrB/UvrC motif-containing protein [Spirochaetota bacterium]